MSFDCVARTVAYSDARAQRADHGSSPALLARATVIALPRRASRVHGAPPPRRLTRRTSPGCVPLSRRGAPHALLALVPGAPADGPARPHAEEHGRRTGCRSCQPRRLSRLLERRLRRPAELSRPGLWRALLCRLARPTECDVPRNAWPRRSPLVRGPAHGLVLPAFAREAQRAVPRTQRRGRATRQHCARLHALAAATVPRCVRLRLAPLARAANQEPGERLAVAPRRVAVVGAHQHDSPALVERALQL